MTRRPTEEVAAFVGIAWAEATHDVCRQAVGSETREFRVLAHTPETIDEWVNTWRTRFQGQPIAIGRALHKGPSVDALRTYYFLGLFPVNPLTLAKYREAFAPSHTKDDPTDAALQLELLLKQRDKLTPLKSQSPAMRALEPLVEHRRLVGDNVRITKRLPSALKLDFPHVLQRFHEKDAAIFCDFLTQ
jgi:Transposase